MSLQADTTAPTPSSGEPQATPAPVPAPMHTSAHLAPNYCPLPVTIATAEGSWVTDTSGKRYFDALAGYSALNFGHRHPALVEAATRQLGRVTLTSRAFGQELLEPFADALARLSESDMVLPMNTGAEAVESALKAARRWAWLRRGIATEDGVIIVAKDNFHGRTTTIISFSSDPAAREGFGPYTPGFVSVPYGDLDALTTAVASVGDRLVAVLLEPIQGEAGVIVPPDEYLPGARALTLAADALLILDEVQSGFGRTGYTFAAQRAGVRPDLMVLGKTLGGGILPVSATVGSADVLELMTVGTHGSTFGGNPLACAVAIAVVKLMESGIYQKAALSLGGHVHSRLQSLVDAGLLTAKRGVGLWAGIDVPPSWGTGRQLCEQLLKKGVLAKDTHGVTVRLSPPLSSEAADIDWMLDRLHEVLSTSCQPASSL